jgi:C4-dicarboxylate transporter DctQ subunit
MPMKKFDKIISKIEEIVLSVSILAMAAVLIGGVISRTVFNSSWTFTEEVGQALNIAVTFFGIGYCARNARHISMSVVYDLVNEKMKKRCCVS